MSQRSCTRLVLAALLFCGAALPNGHAEEPRPTIEQLAWLSGTWEETAGKASIEEHWTDVKGGTLFGVSRTVVAGKTVAFEFLRIEARADGIFYVAQPNGRPPTDFKLVRLEGESVTFENPHHDFPQRIIYKKNTDGALHARVEGARDGKPSGQDVHLRPARKN